MTTETKLTEFRVIVRADSALYVPRAKRLNLSVPAGGRITKAVLYSLWEPRNIEWSLPAQLIFDMSLMACDIDDAVLVAQSFASALAAWIAFLHNGHVGPPLWWVAYARAPIGEWRQIKQTLAPSASPGRPVRELLPSLIRAVPPLLAFEDRPILSAICAYLLALEHWKPRETMLAAQFLYIATETTAERVLEEYERRKPEEAAAKRSELLVEAMRPNWPVDISAEDQQTILAIFAKYPAHATAQAMVDDRLKDIAMQAVVFTSNPNVYADLKKKVRKRLEPAFGISTDMFLSTFEVADQAAPMVRNWLLELVLHDANLRSTAMSDECSKPRVDQDVIFTAQAEFLTWTTDPPLTAERFMNIKPVVGMNLEGKRHWSVDASTNFTHNTNVRRCQGGVLGESSGLKETLVDETPLAEPRPTG